MQQIWLEIEASCVIADVVGEIGRSTRRCHLERCEPMRNRAKRCAWDSAYRQGHEHILNVALRVIPLPHFLG